MHTRNPGGSGVPEVDVLDDVQVQIVVPVHTLDRPIRRAVESVLADPRSSAIVVAHNVAPEKLDVPEDPRVQIVHLEGAQGKPGAAFDAGIAAATASWVGIMGSDDWFAPGALAALQRHALEDRADFVLVPLSHQHGAKELLPRTLRNRSLRAARDRLFYRTAPLGIGRRGLMQSEQFRFGSTFSVGEDMQTSVRLWTSDLSISYYPDDPAYVVGADAKTRTTLTRRPLAVHGAAWADIWNDAHVVDLEPAEREALAVKIARVHVHGAVAARPHPEDWEEGDFEWLSELMARLLDEAPHVLQSFRQSTVATLTSLAQGDLAGTLAHLAEEEMAGARGLAPGSLGGWVAVDGPVRNRAVQGLHGIRTRLQEYKGKGMERAAPQRRNVLFDRWSIDTVGHRPTEADHSGAVLPAHPRRDERPTLLILSFSPIRNDARVRRQVELFRDKYRVTTCSFGPAPDGVVAHIELPSSLLPTAVDGRLITLKQYRVAYWAVPAIRNAWNELRGRRFDAVLADDIEAVPLALRLRPKFGVHADLHEHFPSLHEDHRAWRRRISPYYSWLVGRYVPRAASVTTVSSGLQRAYRAQFGFSPELVPNATPYAELSPTAVKRPIRLVHSGAGQRKRHLEVMLDAVCGSSADVTLDLFVTANDPRYLDELKEKYGNEERVTFNDPVPYEELVETLNAYDIGVFARPAGTFSQRWALPNKFFDFIQARLGIIISPSPEMGPLVEAMGNGVVAAGSDARALSEVLEGLTAEEVFMWKQRSDVVASALAGESLAGPWERALDSLLGERP